MGNRSGRGQPAPIGTGCSPLLRDGHGDLVAENVSSNRLSVAVVNVTSTITGVHMSLGQVGVGGRGAGASVVLVNTYWCPGLCLAKRSPCALESYVGASPSTERPSWTHDPDPRATAHSHVCSRHGLRNESVLRSGKQADQRHAHSSRP
jgi:hypothetical protein